MFHGKNRITLRASLLKPPCYLYQVGDDLAVATRIEMNGNQWLAFVSNLQIACNLRCLQWRLRHNEEWRRLVVQNTNPKTWPCAIKSIITTLQRMHWKPCIPYEAPDEDQPWWLMETLAP